jgi:hypothetical protein
MEELLLHFQICFGGPADVLKNILKDLAAGFHGCG